MDFFFDFIAGVLSFFYDITSSYGMSIMLLTLVVMVAVTPLTLKGTRSMIAMQRLQPELRKLQAKYKDDRQKLNEEMMAFYKEHNINPVGGCVPLLVQAPVFMILYRVLRGLTQMPGYGYDMGGAVGLALRNPAGGGYNSTYGTFDPGYLNHTSQMYIDLNASREMRWWGMDLADSFMNELRNQGVVHALPYLLLVLAIGVSAWYQQRQIQARNSGSQSQINPQQQAIMKVMPFFLPAISLTLPAGLTLYFLVSNLYRVGQQAFITRTMYADEASKPSSRADAPSRKDTVPTGSKGILGGFIQLPGKGSEGDGSANGAAKGGSTGAKSGSAKGGTAKSGAAKGGGATSGTSKSGSAKGGGGTKGSAGGARSTSPSRSAPARPSDQNRSKKKKPRR